ncbi:hypothetical protein JBL43_13225 [Aureibaculum sp. A20]|uniref:YopX protein domain-containing protein n=1 Tax=Aureibaculum flavum TaxID=2795986 RepID=A0ABS0WTB4_9FLAO|nr:hypothetical protein [Aureibaculum flavum]MBJ2175208.1 hypothetical protein [Aureibaculum flavum]
MNISNLIGTYNIIGSNQDDTDINYKGTLTLKLDSDNRIQAKWLINNNQEQNGTGFFKDNILVVNFNYLGENNIIFKGVVVYKCISKDILEGFWSEEFGDPLYLGEENCFRVKDKNELIN